jgi:putative redox protein
MAKIKIKRVPQTGLRVLARMASPHCVTVDVADRSGNTQPHKAITLDMPELLGGTDRGPMPLEALMAAYAGSINVTGNFVAHTSDFELANWELTVWAEFDPSGIWGLNKVAKPIIVVHVEAVVTTAESEKRLKQLRLETQKRDPMHNLLKKAGAKFKEKWTCVKPA